MRLSVPHLSFLCRSLMSTWSSADATSSHCKHSWSSCPIGKPKSMAKPSQTSPTYSSNTCTSYISSNTTAHSFKIQMSQSLFMMSNCTQYTYKPCQTHTNTHRAAFQSECVYMGVMHDCAIWWIVVVVRCIHPISSTVHKIRHTYQYTQTKQKKHTEERM